MCPSAFGDRELLLSILEGPEPQITASKAKTEAHVYQTPRGLLWIKLIRKKARNIQIAWMTITEVKRNMAWNKNNAENC